MFKRPRVKGAVPGFIHTDRVQPVEVVDVVQHVADDLPQRLELERRSPDMWIGLSTGQGETVSPAVAGETVSGPSGPGGGGRVGVDAWSL